MTLAQVKEMIQNKIEYKEHQIKVRKLQLEAGKYETIVDLIEVEIRNLQKDIEFFKSLLKELEAAWLLLGIFSQNPRYWLH